ncbi:MAG: hypothetical protein L3J46_04010, partial [Kangiellaceae bacterium]|nr:hypothetical protein [Kangiellaceae bacterium]
AEFDNDQLRSNLDVNYQSEVFRAEDFDPISLESANTIFNASLILEPTSGKWSISLLGKNLGDDTDRFSYAADVPLFAGAHSFAPSPGRSYTVEFKYIFE